jgi:uncharacterized protein YdeI (YjbR/CyaY-like superfamily)
LSAADDPTLTFASADDWEEWLGESGASAAGVWIKVAKKGSGIASVTHAEALDVALCFGWIDGQRKSFDERYFLQRFTPRRPRSIWSQRNREHIERLTAAGRMRPAGRREVDAAKADGRWDAAYEAQGSAEVPDDLQRELDADPQAAAFFATLSSQNRYAILFRLATAKRPETRARRLATFVEMLRNGETLH